MIRQNNIRYFNLVSHKVVYEHFHIMTLYTDWLSYWRNDCWKSRGLIGFILGVFV